MEDSVCRVDRMSLADYYLEIVVVDGGRRVSVEVLSDLRYDGYKLLVSSHRASEEDIGRAVECAKRVAEDYISFLKKSRATAVGR